MKRAHQRISETKGCKLLYIGNAGFRKQLLCFSAMQVIVLHSTQP
jgi:hypothetical protein